MSIISRVRSERLQIGRGGGVFSSTMETYGLGLGLGLGLRLGVGGRALVFRRPLPGCLLPLHPCPHRSSPLRLRPRHLAVKAASSRDDALSLPLADGQVSPCLPSRFLQVVLVSPQIPGNTGCIARTCAASAVALHLVGPLGFLVDDAKLKRAGLDYWPYVVVKVHESWAAFRDYFKKQDGQKRLLAFTKRGSKVHSDFSYQKGDWLVFGSETSGLSDEVLVDCRSQMYGGGTIRIPMVETYVRCLNLSVSVGISLYEACRQLNYEQLQPMCDCRDDTESLFITEDIFA